MSRQQRDALDQLLRDAQLDLGGDVAAIGTAASSVALASELARRAGARAVTVDYRLAPEHPYPAGLDDAVAAYRGLLESGVPASTIAIAGSRRARALPPRPWSRSTTPAYRNQPTTALLMSPWADLTLSGDSIRDKAAVDPALTPEGLQRRAVDYVAGGDPWTGIVSPICADLTTRSSARRSASCATAAWCDETPKPGR